MARNVRLQELLVGIEGLALLRHLYDGSDDAAGRRLAEIRRILDDGATDVAEPVEEVDPRPGYALWSEHYDDEHDNPIVGLEEPPVRALVDSLPPGPALDVACGTGRHTRYLVARGHDVVGLDQSRPMLGRARATVPGARFVEADLRRLPVGDATVPLVVCGLALAHVADLAAAVAELSRVLAGGGHLIVSTLHPLQALLGWHAPFRAHDGRRRFVREHPHTHGDYVGAFVTAGLRVRRCLEPVLSDTEVRAKRRAFRHVPEATRAAYHGLPAVVIWHVQKESSR